MRTVVTYLLVVLLIFQIGCSSITQIPLPIETSKSEDKVRRLNYLGGRLSSTIHLNDSSKIEAHWLNLKNNKHNVLSNKWTDPSFIEIEKVKSINFYDWWRGCLGGGMFSILFGSLVFGIVNLTKDKNTESNYSFAPIIITVLSLGYGMYALGEIEFDFVQNE